MEFIRHSCGGLINTVFYHRGHPPSSLMDYGGQAESTEGFSLTWVFSKKFSYESKLSTMIFSCPPEQLSVLFPPQADKFKVSEKKDKVSFDKKTCSVENRKLSDTDSTFVKTTVDR